MRHKINKNYWDFKHFCSDQPPLLSRDILGIDLSNINISSSEYKNELGEKLIYNVNQLKEIFQHYKIAIDFIEANIKQLSLVSEELNNKIK